MKKPVGKENKSKIRINTTLIGEPARWLCEWKRRGLVTSYTDAVLQALRIFNEKLVEQDLKSAQLQNIRNVKEEQW